VTDPRLDASLTLWEQHARHDPLWAILSDPSFRHRKWNTTQFFETGAREISLLMYQLEDFDVPQKRARALDFGCGVGRLTQALGNYFAEVIGVDIAPTMIRLASKLNRMPDRVRYQVNDAPDLRTFESGSFDLIYSDIVLQHLDPELALGYVSEFARLLSGEGVAVFQLPSHTRRHEDVRRPVAMAPDAYQAALVIHPPAPTSLRCSERTALAVTIENISSEEWSSDKFGVFRVGNHWLDGRGTMLIQDDGRTDLPMTLAPSAKVTTRLVVKAPAIDGIYQCQIDVVHEGITWFGDRGSDPVDVSIRVGDVDAGVPVVTNDVNVSYPDINNELGPLSGPAPDFPMFGVPQHEVRQLLERLGLKIIFIEEDERAGPEWIGFKYFAVRQRTEERLSRRAE
jgi:SAM-dependent methyltransferase